MYAAAFYARGRDKSRRFFLAQIKNIRPDHGFVTLLLFWAYHVQCAHYSLLSGGTMHLKDEQIGRLAEKVLGDLERAGLITQKQGRGTVLEAIKSAIGADLKTEAALERDAEALLEQTLRSVGGEGIDRHRMLKMIKDKLAKERKIVL